MAVPSSLVAQHRRLIGDTDSSNQSFTDLVLQDYLLDSVGEINVFLPNSASVDTTALTISPTPSRGGVFHSLFAIQAAIDLLSGQTVSNARKAIRIRDGDTAIDTSVGLSGSSEIVEILTKKRDALVAQAKKEGLGADGNVWDSDQIIETTATDADLIGGDTALADTIIV